jgi:hypothetical protein
MYSLVNLRRKGGALHPVGPHVVEQEMCGEYDIYFIHRNEDRSHWIGVVNDAGGGTSDVYRNINASECPEVKVLKLDTGGVINSVEQNGNLLVFVTDDTVYYALFKDGDYRWYGELPDLTPIEWNCNDEYELYSAEPGIGYENRGMSFLYVAGGDPDDRLKMSELDAFAGQVANRGYAKMTYDWLLKEGHLLGYNENVGGFRGLFQDAFFVRYAYRLFDGSHVKISPPILLMPQNPIADQLRIAIYFDPLAGTYNNYVRWSYGATYTEDDDPTFRKGSSRMFMKAFSPGMKYDLTSLSGYGGLIEGIDVFMSPSINYININNANTALHMTSSGGGGAGTWSADEVPVVSAKPAGLEKRAGEMELFYFVKELKPGETTGGAYKRFCEQDDLDMAYRVTNLVQQERLTDDDFSIRRTGARHSYTYNGRLHLADIKTTFFSGFPFDFFKWQNVNNWQHVTDNDPSTATPADLRAYYNGDHQGYIPLYTAGDMILVEVELYYKNTSGVCVSRAYAFPATGYYALTAYISYPDASAKRMTFYLKRAGEGVYTALRSFEMKEHPMLNLAYYLEEDFKSISLLGGSQTPLIKVPGVSFSAVGHNELLLSDVNNPLEFQVKNMLAVGEGRILAIGSNVMNVANWNFGSYPLYVFTSEGVYVLKVGEGDVAYSVITQAAYLEGPVSDVICQTPQGVVFAVARGLCIINGTQVDFLSKAVEEDPADLRFETAPEMEGVLPDYGKEPFRAFLKGLTGMVYDNYRNELVIMNRSKDYNWVFSFDDGSFYVTTERIDRAVQNSLPELRVVSGRKLLDFSREEGSAHVSFITRPLLYGTEDVKRMERMVMRGVIYGLGKVSGKLPVVVTHYSNDGRNFLISKGLFLKEGNHKDLDTGLYGRSRFRQYVFSFGGVCGRETVIGVLESAI